MLNPSPDIISRFAKVVGEKNAITDPEKQTPYLVEFRACGPGIRRWCCGRARPRKCRNSSRSPTRPRPRSCPRAATPGWSAGSSPHNGEVVLSLNRMDKIREVDAVSNTITCEAGVTLAARARSRRQRRPALSATAAVGRHLHHRRQSLDQCRRHRGARTRRRALARARARSGAGRRPHPQQPEQAQEGQHRLRPQKPVHRRRRHARRHHRGGAAPGAAAALGRDRMGRDPVGAGRGRSAGACRRTHRRRRHQLRDHVTRGHRDRGQARRCAQSARHRVALLRADRAVVAAARGPARVAGADSGRRSGEGPRARRHDLRERRAGQGILENPRAVRRDAGPRGRLDQARRVGAGRQHPGLHRGRQRGGA